MRRVSCCLLALVLAAAAPAAHAQLPVGRLVFDPGNYAQNLLTAARTLEQIQHQIAQLEQQAKMLAQNPLQLSPELSASIGEARALFETARGIAYDIRRIGEDVRALYPETWEAHDLAAVLAQSDRWLQQSRASLETAMAMQARAAQSLEQSRGRIEAALGASAGAEGQTSAVQAGNQLLGVSAAELAEIRALLVAQGRALAVERMEQLAREERAREIQRRAFPNASPAAPPPARTAF
jgi:P-type conjugative transfer protein TrbJ